MPLQPWGWLVTERELRGWVLEDTPDYVAINKPGYLVCHPSKFGEWSSLVGAVRAAFGLERVHPAFRLDRETSGVVVLAKNHETASLLQKAVERRRLRKTYLAVLTGELRDPTTVDAPLGRAAGSQVWIRQAVQPAGSGYPAETEFVPLASAAGYTLARVHPATGRLHQIRVHAAHIGHPVAGDKLYGPDEALFLEFIREGFTPHLAAALPLPRQALHAAEVEFDLPGRPLRFAAPLAEDMVQFCLSLGITPEVK
jgi:23S rRNA pseudouridine1911/1915/1917 synthase